MNSTTDTTNVPPATPPPAPAPDLTLGDLKDFVQVIDVCSRRGAFEGAELAAIGALRNRVAAFVSSKTPPPAAPDAPAPEQTPVA